MAYSSTAQRYEDAARFPQPNATNMAHDVKVGDAHVPYTTWMNSTAAPPAPSTDHYRQPQQTSHYQHYGFSGHGGPGKEYAQYKAGGGRGDSYRPGSAFDGYGATYHSEQLEGGYPSTGWQHYSCPRFDHGASNNYKSNTFYASGSASGYRGASGTSYDGQGFYNQPTWQKPAPAFRGSVHSTASAPAFAGPHVGSTQPVYAPPHYYAAQNMRPWYSPVQQSLTQPWHTAAKPPVREAPRARNYSINAPSFVPVQQKKSVYAEPIHVRAGINKQSRYGHTRSKAYHNTVDNASSQLQHHLSRPSDEQDGGVRIDSPFADVGGSEAASKIVDVKDRYAAAPFNKGNASLEEQLLYQLPASPRPKRSNVPTQRLLRRPEPSNDYLQTAMKPPTAADSPQRLLVILDLNGTLLWRKNRGTSFIARPKVNEFLEYLFRYHDVMIWSSARPENVHGLAQQLLTAQHLSQVVAIWARDKLHLSAAQYKAKVQVYKQLSWVWEKMPNYDQTNTVLIDDSVEKAASEPYNLLEIEEFEARAEQMRTDVLIQVAWYLNKLVMQKNVSAYMRATPFTFVPEREMDWHVVLE